MGTYLFALPGSPAPGKDAWDEILAPQFDARHRPCNFVEIMPRLDEHLRRKINPSCVRHAWIGVFQACD